MAMTKKTITTWNGKIPNPDANPEFSSERDTFMQGMLDAGKTDSLTATLLEGNAFQRNWSDEAAANEFVTFLNSSATNHGLSHTTTIDSL